MKIKLITFFFTTIITGTAVAQQKIDLQAHRGGMALMPENTIASMINGVKTGAQTLELDVVISADGKVVVSHDLYMSAEFMRKPDGSDIPKAEEKNYLLYKMTYDSIRSYDAGTRPHPRSPEQAKIKTYKPLLADLIDSVEAFVKSNRLKPVYYNIEIKSSPEGDGTMHPAPAVFVTKVLDVLNKKQVGKRLIIQSFDIRPLQILHKTASQIQLSYLVSRANIDEDIAKLGFTPNIYSPSYTELSEDIVDKAHKLSMRIVPWTVDDEKSMTALVQMGVDGIISNYPDKMTKLFGSYQDK